MSSPFARNLSTRRLMAALFVGAGLLHGGVLAQNAGKPEAEPRGGGGSVGAPAEAKPARKPERKNPDESRDGLGVRFEVATTVVEAGRTHMLAFLAPGAVKLAPAAAASESDDSTGGGANEDKSKTVREGKARLADEPAPVVIASSVSDVNVLAVVRPAEVIPGYEVGFVRVLALRPGTAELRVGGAVQRVTVVPARSGAWSELSTPRIVAPLDGAVIWPGALAGGGDAPRLPASEAGDKPSRTKPIDPVLAARQSALTVGVSWTDNPASPNGVVKLEILGASGVGRLVESTSLTDLSQGPTRTASFELSAGDMSPDASGVLTLTPVAMPAQGPVSSLNPQGVRGPSTRVRIIPRPSTAELASPGELGGKRENDERAGGTGARGAAAPSGAATTMGSQMTVELPPGRAGTFFSIPAADLKEEYRPERFNRGKVVTGADQRAFGGRMGRVVINNSADPTLGVRIEVPSTGLYQMIVTAAGDWAGGVYPTVALVVDGANQPVTSGQLVMNDWHRVVVGVPVMLEAGTRTLSARFENDFGAGNLGDRNLRLETIEIARVSDVALGTRVASAKGGGEGEMMAGGGEMMAGATMQGEGEAMMMTGPGAKNAGEKVDPATQPLSAMDPLLLQADDLSGTAWRPSRVALTSIFDRQEVTGVVTIEGVCAWDAADRTRAPLVRLMVNGVEVSSQYAATVRFKLDPSWLKPGENRVWLESVAHNGLTARSATQRLVLPTDLAGPDFGAVSEETTRGRARAVRYTMHDPAWSASLKERSRLQGDAPQFRRCALPGGVDYVLRLPGAMAGTYRVTLEARGNASKGLPTVKLLAAQGAGGEAKEVGAGALRSSLSMVELGTVTLTPGAKTLTLRYDQTGYEATTSEAGMYFESLWLEPVASDSEDRAKGSGSGGTRAKLVVSEVVYPPPPTPIGSSSHVSFEADALVVRAFAGHGLEISSAELLIDGKPTGIVSSVAGKPGLIYLPAPMRGLSVGTHELSAKISANRGEKGPAVTVTTESRTVTVTGEMPRGGSRFARAAAMAERFAFGPDDATMAGILSLGEQAWLERELGGSSIGSAESTDDGFVEPEPALSAAVAKFVLHRREQDVAARVVTLTSLTRTPVRARLVNWVQNHFTTWSRKVEPDRKWAEFERFNRLGNAPLGDLLISSATSPAMMLYLDQQNSYKGRLNENYAREVMELHTLGVKAGYTQSDVTAMARLITGWIAARQGESEARNDKDVRTYEFRFDPRMNDEKAQRVFGVRFEAAEPAARFDRALMALEMLARHPQTSRFIARQLCEHYAQSPADPRMIEDVALVFQTSGGDLGACVRAIAQHPLLDLLGAPRLAHPLDFALRLQRTHEQVRAEPVAGFLRRCKAGIFDCPTPDGYALEDAPWADSNAMIQRLKLAREQSALLASIVPESLRSGNAALQPEREQLLIDLLAMRLTGSLLSERSNDAVKRVLATVKGNALDRAREAAAMVASMPEANLR
ncbi:MAG: DUF1800 family protein [Phycisphaerales bacterium]|nr:DUF1800 family protein [Phycisphaerales bacterium]